MSYNSAEINEFSDIWVFCEQREGKLMNTDFELISEGRKLADERGSKLVGILLGGEGIENSAKELGGIRCHIKSSYAQTGTWRFTLPTHTARSCAMWLWKRNRKSS